MRRYWSVGTQGIGARALSQAKAGRRAPSEGGELPQRASVASPDGDSGWEADDEPLCAGARARVSDTLRAPA
jgi:hypothetical protein